MKVRQTYLLHHAYDPYKVCVKVTLWVSWRFRCATLLYAVFGLSYIPPLSWLACKLEQGGLHKQWIVPSGGDALY